MCTATQATGPCSWGTYGDGKGKSKLLCKATNKLQEDMAKGELLHKATARNELQEDRLA